MTIHENNGLEIGDIVIFNYDHRGMKLAGKHGVVESQEYNLWAVDYIRAEDNQLVRIDWGNRNLVSIADDGWKPKRSEKPSINHKVRTTVLLFVFLWGLLSVVFYAELASVLLMALPAAFLAGAKLQRLDTEYESKQQKRDEHERIARLIETDEEEDTNHYGQEIPAITHYTRTRKPF